MGILVFLLGLSFVFLLCVYLEYIASLLISSSSAHELVLTWPCIDVRVLTLTREK